MRFKFMAIAAVAAAALAGAAQADTISSLYNTGVDAAGTPAANNALELHYVIVGDVAARVANESNGYPNNVWIGDNALSSWIGPVGTTQLDGHQGAYDYRTTFDLTGFDHTTAVIAGRWALDDDGLDILINGVSTGHTATWNTWTSFSIASGFQAGLNTLDFIIQNSNTFGPTGLRVEMTGTANTLSVGVPEPAAWALMIGGFGLAGATLRRRRTVLPA